MKKVLFALIGCAMLATYSVASETEKQTREDVARHRVMAAAHEAAAKCREAGKGEDVCSKELAKACKGIAIGKYCGMKHQH